MEYYDTPKIATIHGGTLYDRPDLFHSGELSRKKSLTLNKLFKNQFDRVTAVSYNLKHRVEQKLDVEIDVIYNGVDERFKVVEGARNYIYDKYGFKDYLLHISNKSKAKNINAINYLKKHYNLIAVGKNWDFGFINQDELVYFYNAAKVFVFPSIHETFGLPNVEAMMCGTPVVTSNAYAIPEVVGDAAIKCDPYDYEEICNGIDKLLNSNRTYRKMVKKGLRRAKKFSWRKTARQYLKIYDDLY